MIEEEAFYERFFECGDDEDTTLKNLCVACDVYFKAVKECSEFALQINDGELVDVPSVVLALKNLILSHKYIWLFKKALGSEDPIVDVYEIDIKDKENLLEEGKLLIEKGMSAKNLRDIEVGNYYVFAATNV